MATLRLSLGAYHLMSVERAYELAGLSRSTLSAIAWRSGVRQPPGVVGVVRRDLANQQDGVVRELEIRADGDSRSIHRAGDFFEDVLLPVLVSFDPRLIRECYVCARFYAAYRKDQSGCDARCMNLHRQWGYRSPERTEQRERVRRERELLLRDTRLRRGQ